MGIFSFPSDFPFLTLFSTFPLYFPQSSIDFNRRLVEYLKLASIKMDLNKILNPISKRPPSHPSGNRNKVRGGEPPPNSLSNLTGNLAQHRKPTIPNQHPNGWYSHTELPDIIDQLPSPGWVPNQPWNRPEHTHRDDSNSARTLSPPVSPTSPVFTPSPSPTNSDSTAQEDPVRPHYSNLRYTEEEVDRIRYLYDDLHLSWSICEVHYNSLVTRPRKRTIKGLNSRYYREQKIKVTPSQAVSLCGNEKISLIAGGQLLEAKFLEDVIEFRLEDGKDVVLRHRIRDRDTDEGREIRRRFGVAYRLVELEPERFLTYNWPFIRECDKEEARERVRHMEEVRTQKGESVKEEAGKRVKKEGPGAQYQEWVGR